MRTVTSTRSYWMVEKWSRDLTKFFSATGEYDDQEDATTSAQKMNVASALGTGEIYLPALHVETITKIYPI